MVLLVAIITLIGCRGERTDAPSAADDTDTVIAQEPAAAALAEARRLIQTGQFDAAVAAASKALLLEPDSAEAKLIASQAEAARGNHAVAADLAASIEIGSQLGQQAVELRHQQLVKLGRYSDAADALLQGIQAYPKSIQWRRLAWQYLNRVGRRELASKQADFLCRTSLADDAVMLSLVRRNDAFPYVIDEGDTPEQHFEPGLGMARWYFTNASYQRAIEELAEEYEAGFSTPEAAALYGRLLAESQRYEELPIWFAKCGNEPRKHADFWSALGTYFFDAHQYEASARALLEAMYRDPTDEFTSHRLGRVFDALGRPEDGEQFRFGGVLLVKTEEAATKLIKSPGDDSQRQELSDLLLQRARPFEALAWSLSTVAEGASEKRRQIETRRADLLQDRSMASIANRSALFGIDPAQFDIQPAMSVLARGAPGSITRPAEAVLPLASPRFVDVAQQANLIFQWYADVEIDLEAIPIHEVMGGGIGVLDYDLDGWPDVYLPQGSGDPPTDACTRSNALFRNLKGNFQRTEGPAGAEDFNYSSGVAAGDVNQDGFPDLLLGAIGRNRLLINNGDGTFADATARWGEIVDRFTSSVAIADLSGDGLPDLFEANYVEMEGGFVLPEMGPDGHKIQLSPLQHFAGKDRWFENLGDGSFQVHEIGEEVAPAGTALGVLVTDFSGDGSNEVFVGNDGRPNHFLIYSDEGKFINAADVKGVSSGFSGEPNACMGIASGDFNRDGTIDLHVTNFLRESANHYLQTAEGSFTDSAARYGLSPASFPHVGFGTKAIDIDNNGWLDLVVTNGHIFDMRHADEPFRMPPQLLINLGTRFDQLSFDADDGYWAGEYLGRSIATIDYDHDGSTDLLIGHIDQPLALLRNATESEGQSIGLELVGTASERDAIGARIVLNAGADRLIAWVTAGDGYLCSDESVVHFGLGDNDRVESVEISWPSGSQQTLSNLKAGERYLVVEGEAEFPRETNEAGVEPALNDPP